MRLNLHMQVHRLDGHPNVTAMLGFVPEGQNDGVPLLALELCETGDLKSCLRKKGNLPNGRGGQGLVQACIIEQ